MSKSYRAAFITSSKSSHGREFLFKLDTMTAKFRFNKGALISSNIDERRAYLYKIIDDILKEMSINITGDTIEIPLSTLSKVRDKLMIDMKGKMSLISVSELAQMIGRYKDYEVINVDHDKPSSR